MKTVVLTLRAVSWRGDVAADSAEENLCRTLSQRDSNQTLVATLSLSQIQISFIKSNNEMDFVGFSSIKSDVNKA